MLHKGEACQRDTTITRLLLLTVLLDCRPSPVSSFAPPGSIDLFKQGDRIVWLLGLEVRTSGVGQLSVDAGAQLLTWIYL